MITNVIRNKKMEHLQTFTVIVNGIAIILLAIVLDNQRKQIFKLKHRVYDLENSKISGDKVKQYIAPATKPLRQSEK